MPQPGRTNAQTSTQTSTGTGATSRAPQRGTNGATTSSPRTGNTGGNAGVNRGDGGAARGVSNGAPARNPRQVQRTAGAAPAERPNLGRMSDVDGSRWKNKLSDDEMMDLVPEREESSGMGGLMQAEQDDDDFGLLDEEGGDEAQLEATDDDQTGEAEQTDDQAAEEVLEEEVPEEDDDAFDAQLRQNEALEAARFLIREGWNRKEVEALYKSAPESLIAAAQRMSGRGNEDHGGEAKGRNPARTVDEAIDHELNDSFTALSKALDGEGADPVISKAIKAQTVAGIKFLGNMVASRIAQLESTINRLGSVVQATELSGARASLADEYPQLSNDKTFAKVHAKAEKLMAGGGYGSIKEAIADAAHQVLGKQTAAAKAVKTAERDKMRSLGSSDDSASARQGGRRAISRDQWREQVFLKLEEGKSKAEVDEYMSKHYKLAQPKPKGE